MATLCGGNFQTKRHSQDERLCTHALYEQLYPEVSSEAEVLNFFFFDTFKIADLGRHLDS